MDEEFESFVVTDPNLVDEGIDVSGLRTQTDVNPFLLGSVAPGIKYEGIGYSPTSIQDLVRYFQFGLPAIDTSQPVTPPSGEGGGGSGDGGQATVPGAINTLVTPPITTDLTDDQIDEVALTGGQPTTPVDNTITIENIGPGREYIQPDGTVINIDPLEEQMLLEELRNEELGTDTFTPTLQPETTGGAPVVSQQLQDEGPYTPDVPTTEVLGTGVMPAFGDMPTDFTLGPAYTGEFDPDDEGTVFDTSGLTDATPEQRNTIQNILTAAGDNVQGALTELGKIPGAVVDFANQTVDFFGKKLNVGKTLASIALNKIAGGPVSLLFDILPEDSLENRTTRSIVDELKSEKDYGFNVQTGTLNQDPFGRNPVSQFGNYEQTLTEDINDPSDTRMGKAKKEFAQDYFDKKAEKAGGVEIDEGTVLGPGEAPGDIVSLEDLQAERDAEIAAQNQLAKLTGDVDTFDTTPSVNEADVEAGLATESISDFVDDFEVSGEPAPTTGGSGVDSFFDAIDTATGGGGDRDDDSGPSAPTGPPSGGFQSESTYDAEEEDETPADRGGGNGGSSSGGGGCVIATHAVNSGAFTKDTKREAVRWCVKNLHKTWWGEAIRRGYRYYGQKAIEEGKAKNHYQEFKDYVAFGTGKRRTLKTGWTFVYRTVQFFLKGLTL